MPNSNDLGRKIDLSGEMLLVKEKTMRIVLADHHPQALWALKTTLQEKSKFEIIGEAKDAPDLLALVVENPPDLVLIDWQLPGKPIEDLITQLHQCKSRPAVIVMGSQPEYGRMLLKAGADAFVSKGDQPDWLLATLQKFQRRVLKKVDE
jgi:DNA-binding NarL/FixJ family response regulator